MNQFTASLWGDEGFSAILSMKPIEQILSIISRDTSPPLYNLLEHFWFKGIGTSEISIRSLSFLFFLFACLFVYKIGKHYWDRQTGILAAVLTAINPFFFFYAFEGRMYSLLAATVTASMYFFISKKWPLYIVATTLALYTHHFAIFAVFVQGLWMFFQFFKGQKQTAYSMFKSFVAIGLLYSPWIIPLYNQTKMVGGGFWLGIPTLRDFGMMLVKFFSVGILLFLFRDWSKKKDISFFLGLWLVFPIAATWIISQKFSSIFFDRYLLYTIPAGILLFVSQKTSLSKFWIIVVFTAYAFASGYLFFHPTKLPFRQLAIYVKQTQQPSDILINEDAGSHKLWESKYYGIPAPIYKPIGSELPYFVGTALMEESDFISEIPKSTKRLGVITFKSNQELEDKFFGFKVQEQTSYGNLRFVWMQRLPISR